MLTVTVPKATYRRIRSEANKRDETISGMLRNAFELYVQTTSELYSDRELQQLLQRDAISPQLRKDLDRLTKKK